MPRQRDFPIVTIDGPSGSGKGTISRATARLMVPLPEPLGPSMVRMGEALGRGMRIGLRQSASRSRPAARAVPTNPGNEVATLATSRISMGARARSAATANAMAMR